MARSFQINGETMVLVKGAGNTAIGAISQLGLCSDAITVTPSYKHLDIDVDAYGEVPPELQSMGMEATVDMTLVHFDFSVLQTCVQLANAGAPAEGTLGHAGALMGNGAARFANGNNYIGLNLQSAAGAQPWRFYYAVLAGQPLTYPLGAERTLARVRWRIVPYSADPWNNGQGSYGVVLWDHVLDQ